MPNYAIVRHYEKHDSKVIKRGLTLREAQEHCRGRETSSTTCVGTENVAHTAQFGPWFDGYTDTE